ncbi:hypothetical protein DFA_11153 [Cavenderia fasciculata]|uniref:EGF-like domain-containing protein n=1 Tax=Cavenderia fasciculata TaxID=261658 RepID=F4QF33_CACFS|nr:uncharacterized protein DFA_11153 [Cavenderia fasciculata]EGG13392.1 hypothetical protein DFA_11153 [Cavenderia fasciculata]|eukprot:XP_004350096.1 hypothetical protein DFA_11153 [Cavenderia fasciculata]
MNTNTNTNTNIIVVVNKYIQYLILKETWHHTVEFTLDKMLGCSKWRLELALVCKDWFNYIRDCFVVQRDIVIWNQHTTDPLLVKTIKIDAHLSIMKAPTISKLSLHESLVIIRLSSQNNNNNKNNNKSNNNNNKKKKEKKKKKRQHNKSSSIIITDKYYQFDCFKLFETFNVKVDRKYRSLWMNSRPSSQQYARDVMTELLGCQKFKVSLKDTYVIPFASTSIVHDRKVDEQNKRIERMRLIAGQTLQTQQQDNEEEEDEGSQDESQHDYEYNYDMDTFKVPVQMNEDHSRLTRFKVLGISKDQVIFGSQNYFDSPKHVTYKESYLYTQDGLLEELTITDPTNQLIASQKYLKQLALRNNNCNNNNCNNNNNVLDNLKSLVWNPVSAGCDASQIPLDLLELFPKLSLSMPSILEQYVQASNAIIGLDQPTPENQLGLVYFNIHMTDQNHLVLTFDHSGYTLNPPPPLINPNTNQHAKMGIIESILESTRVTRLSIIHSIDFCFIKGSVLQPTINSCLSSPYLTHLEISFSTRGPTDLKESIDMMIKSFSQSKSLESFYVRHSYRHYVYPPPPSLEPTQPTLNQPKKKASSTPKPLKMKIDKTIDEEKIALELPQFHISTKWDIKAKRPQHFGYSLGEYHTSYELKSIIENTAPVTSVRLKFQETGAIVNSSVTFGVFATLSTQSLIQVTPYLPMAQTTYFIEYNTQSESVDQYMNFNCKSLPSTLTIKSSNINRYVQDGIWVVDVLTTVDFDLVSSQTFVTCTAVSGYVCAPIYPQSTATATIPMRFKLSISPQSSMSYTPATDNLFEIGMSTTTITNPIISGSLFPTINNTDLAGFTSSSSPEVARTIGKWVTSNYHLQLNVNSSSTSMNELQFYSVDGSNTRFLRKVLGNSLVGISYFKELSLSSTMTNRMQQVAEGGYRSILNVTYQIGYLADQEYISSIGASGYTDKPNGYNLYLETQVADVPYLQGNVQISTYYSVVSLPLPFGLHRSSSGFVFRAPFMLPRGLNTTPVTFRYLSTMKSYTANNGKSFPTGAKPPTITGVSYYPFTGYSCFVKVGFESDLLTGLRSITIYNTVFSLESIVSGDFSKGELTGEVKFNPFSLATDNTAPIISMSDTIGMTIAVVPGQFLSTDAFVPYQLDIPQLFLRPDNFTSLLFAPNDIDTSYGPSFVSMLFNLTETPSSPIFNISILLTKLNADGQFGSRSISSLSYFDSVVNSYRSDFILPQNLGNDTIEYFFNQYTHSTTLNSKLGSLSQLRVKSNNLDKFPPMITYIKPNLDLNNVGFDIRIIDKINGLDYGVVNITSDMDPIPRTFVLDVNSLVNGSMFEGDHSIRFNYNLPTETCRTTQLFRITGLYLVDRSGWSSYYPSQAAYIPNRYNVETLIDPFIQLASPAVLQFTINCSLPVITVPGPMLTNLIISRPSLDVGSNNRDMWFLATFQDQSGTGISLRHTPTLYLTDALSNYFLIPGQLGSINGGTVNYNFAGTIPYGFGASSNLSVSIYGVFDNALHTLGMSSVEIFGKSSSYPYFVQTFYSPYNIVLRYAMTNIPRDGGAVTVATAGVSQHFQIPTTEFNVVINEPGFSQTLPATFTGPMTFTFVIPVPIPAQLTSIRITLKSATVTSQALSIPVQDYRPVYTPPAIVPCPNGCGGSDHGTCGDNGCACINGWYGPTCSQTTIQVIPNITKTEPTIIIGNQNTTSTTDRFIYSIVSIVSIREIEMDGTTYKEYPLTTWAYTNQTTDMSKSINYFYNSTLSIPTDSTNSSFTNTTISVSVQWFRDAQEISFGNQPISLPPSSTKINIGIDQYPFQSITNTLQIIMDISINIDDNDACSELDYGLGNGNDENDVQWVKLKVGGSSIYARFIRSGIIDGRQAVIRNSVVEKQESSGTRQFIGINVPYYTENIQLDPDLSMLVDNGDGDYGCGDTKPVLTNAQIAGIAVAGSIVLLASTFLIVWYIRKKYFIRFTGGKIEMVTMK